MTVIGYAPGAFDMFHIGHVRLLRHAARACDYLIAGAVTDQVLTRVKGRAPMVPLDERLAILSRVDCVDEAVVDVSSDKFEMWKLLGYDILFKGDDWRGTERAIRLEELLGQVGAKLVYFPYTLSTSSTQVRRTLTGGRG